MSFRLASVLRGCLAVAVLVWGGVSAGTALAQDKPPKLAAEVSAPRNPGAGTNATQPLAPRNGLLRLEEQLSRSFQFFKPTSSLEGLPAPPLRRAPPPLSKRAKDAIDRQKNWVFQNPDEVTAAPKWEDMLDMPQYGLDGMKKKSASPVERFYQDLEARKAAKAKRNPLAANDPLERKQQQGLSQDQDATDDSALPPEVRSNEKALRKLLLGGPRSVFDPATQNRGLDIFGLGQQQTSPEEELARKAYLKDFQQWLNRPASPPATVPGNPMNDPSQPGVLATAGLSAYGLPARPANYDPSIGAANPTLLVGTPQDITTKVLNQWNPLYTPPKVEPPKPPSLPPSDYVPRRKF